MPGINASVGKFGGGKQCYNIARDQQVVQDLLNKIPAAQGGAGGALTAPIIDRVVSASLHEAILEFQRVNHCSVDGHVDPNEHTIQLMNQLAGTSPGRNPQFIIRGANLQLLFQQTTTLGGFTHSSYLSKAESLLSGFGLGLNITNRRTPEFEFTTVDPSNGPDIASVRALAENQVPGLGSVLRVIFCRFPQSAGRIFASTHGGAFPLEGGSRVPDFILIDVGKRQRDNCSLIHEMIHATGLVEHDSDPTSVFSIGTSRTVLKPEHAERLSKAFFAQVR
jgi:hypothetical protein